MSGRFPLRIAGFNLAVFRLLLEAHGRAGENGVATAVAILIVGESRPAILRLAVMVEDNNATMSANISAAVVGTRTDDHFWLSIGVYVGNGRRGGNELGIGRHVKMGGHILFPEGNAVVTNRHDVTAIGGNDDV